MRVFKLGSKAALSKAVILLPLHRVKDTELEVGKGVSRRTVTAVSYIRDAEIEYAIEPHGRNIIAKADTTGAGDAFATGFIYGLLGGKGLEECGCLGDIMAQFSISKVGAREGLPAFTQLARYYQELYSTQP